MANGTAASSPNDLDKISDVALMSLVVAASSASPVVAWATR